MKLIEVIVLMGAHCVSPIQTSGVVTEAAKVQCAVVVEKDTAAGTFRIVPAGASRRPEVVAVLQRLADALPSSSAPASSNSVVQPPLETTTENVTAEKPKPQTTAKKDTAAVNDRSKTTGAAKQPAKSKCLGEAKPKWYKTTDGRRKYKCVLPG